MARAAMIVRDPSLRTMTETRPSLTAHRVTVSTTGRFTGPGEDEDDESVVGGELEGVFAGPEPP